MNQGPKDPAVREIVRLIQSQQLSRRKFLKSGMFGAAAASTLGLAACSSKDSITWGNWTYYLDYDEETGTNPTLDAFNEQASFTVQHVEDIDDNNTFYGKIRDALQLGDYTGYDVITMTDWMNARLIAADQLQEFDYSNLPNVESNLVSFERDALTADPGRRFTIPWQLPATGWAWNKEAFPDGLHELDDLLDPRLKGRVQVLSEMRDTIGLILAGQGVDPQGDWGDAEFDNALAWLKDALDSGQISNVKGNDYTQDLETGTMLAGFVWYGDVQTMNVELDDQWGVEIPESGGMLASDSFSIPNGTTAENKAHVEELINYYYQPEIAAEVSAYVNYMCPVEGAQEAMQSIDADQAKNPAIFPTEADLQNLRHFRELTPEEDNRYQTAFQRVLGL